MVSPGRGAGPFGVLLYVSSPFGSHKPQYLIKHPVHCWCTTSNTFVSLCVGNHDKHFSINRRMTQESIHTFHLIIKLQLIRINQDTVAKELQT